MLRNILALLAALAACFVVIAAIQALNFWLNPPPPGLDMSDPKVVEALLPQLPARTLIMLELSYLLGSLCGGWVVGRFAVSRHLWLALLVGAVFTGANVLNLIQIPHPVWLATLTTVTFIPMALLGARLARGARAAA